jgi:hypothetical protein
MTTTANNLLRLAQQVRRFKPQLEVDVNNNDSIIGYVLQKRRPPIIASEDVIDLAYLIASHIPPLDISAETWEELSRIHLCELQGVLAGQDATREIRTIAKAACDASRLDWRIFNEFLVRLYITADAAELYAKCARDIEERLFRLTRLPKTHAPQPGSPLDIFRYLFNYMSVEMDDIEANGPQPIEWEALIDSAKRFFESHLCGDGLR